MKKVYVLLLLLIISNLSIAQINWIKGLVVDEDKQPLGGCLVINPEEDTVIADVDGKFEIKGNIGDSLVFRFIFYRDTIIRVQDTSFLTITYRKKKTHDLCILAVAVSDVYNLEFFNDIKTHNFLFEYRHSFKELSPKEFGWKPINNLTNYMDLGISYIKWNENYISLFSQFNDFYTYKAGWIKKWYYSVFSPYINIGINFSFTDFVPSPRFDFGVKLFQVSYSGYFSFSVSSQLMTGVYGIGYFVGFTLTKRVVWETGWY